MLLPRLSARVEFIAENGTGWGEIEKRLIAMERIVTVWDKQYKISVSQRSKTVWIARGEYMGKAIETKGSSANAAAKHW